MTHEHSIVVEQVEYVLGAEEFFENVLWTSEVKAEAGERIGVETRMTAASARTATTSATARAPNKTLFTIAIINLFFTLF